MLLNMVYLFSAVSYNQVVSAGKLAKSTVTLFLLLFSCIFGRESRRKCNYRTITQALDVASELLPFCKQNKEFHEKAPFTLGEFFCKIFLDQLNRFMSIGQDKKTVLSALSLLFVLSTSSKQFALENGFLESTMEDIKDIHVKLNLASLQFEKEGTHKRKVMCVPFLIIKSLKKSQRFPFCSVCLNVCSFLIEKNPSLLNFYSTKNPYYILYCFRIQKFQFLLNCL